MSKRVNLDNKCDEYPDLTAFSWEPNPQCICHVMCACVDQWKVACTSMPKEKYTFNKMNKTYLFTSFFTRSNYSKNTIIVCNLWMEFGQNLVLNFFNILLVKGHWYLKMATFMKLYNFSKQTRFPQIYKRYRVWKLLIINVLTTKIEVTYPSLFIAVGGWRYRAHLPSEHHQSLVCISLQCNTCRDTCNHHPLSSLW